MLELVTKLNITGTFSNSLKQGLAGMRAAAQEINKAGKTFQRGASRAAKDMRKSEKSSDKIKKNADSVQKSFSKGALNLGRMGDLFARSVTRLRYSAISLLGGGALAAGAGAAVGFTLRQNDQFLQRNIGLASSVASAYGGTFNERFAQAPGLSRELGRMAAVTPGTEAEFSTAFAQLSQIMSGSGLDIARNTQNMLIGGQLSRGAEGRGFIIQDIVSALQEGNINVRQMKDLAFVMRNAYGGDFETKFDSAGREGQENLIVDALNKMTDLQEELKNSFEVQLTTVQSLLTAVFLEFTSAFAGKATGLVGGGASFLQNNFTSLLTAAKPLGDALANIAPLLGVVTVVAGVFATLSMGLITFVAAAGAVLSVISGPMVVGLSLAAAAFAMLSGVLMALGSVVVSNLIYPSEEAKESIGAMKASLTTMVVRIKESSEAIVNLGSTLLGVFKGLFGNSLMEMIAGGLMHAAAAVSILTGVLELFIGGVIKAVSILGKGFEALITGKAFSPDWWKDKTPKDPSVKETAFRSMIAPDAYKTSFGFKAFGSNVPGVTSGGVPLFLNPSEFNRPKAIPFDPTKDDRSIGDQLISQALLRIKFAYGDRKLKNLEESAVLEKLMKEVADVFKNTTNIENVNVEVRAETLEDPQRAALVIDEILAEVVERSMSAGNNAFSGGR